MILANVVLIGDERRTAAARHLPPGTIWTDHLSGDGSRCLSIVEGNMFLDTITSLVRDMDVLETLGLPDGSIDPERLDLVRYGAGRFDIPLDAMPEIPDADDIIAAARRRMTLSQITLDQDLAKVGVIEEAMARNLRSAGFDPEEIRTGPPSERMKKVQRKKDL